MRYMLVVRHQQKRKQNRRKSKRAKDFLSTAGGIICVTILIILVYMLCGFAAITGS